MAVTKPDDCVKTCSGKPTMVTGRSPPGLGSAARNSSSKLRIFNASSK